MNRVSVTLIALVLLPAPIFVAVPDTPDEFLWSSWLCAAVFAAVLCAVFQKRRQEPIPLPSKEEKGILLLLVPALFSLFARLLVQHTTAYLGLMLHGWAVLAADAALFLLCRQIAARSRAALYGLIVAAVFASAIVAAWGVGEYLLHAAARVYTARIFSTSTPDFLAGYLVLLLPVTLALFLGIPRTANPQAPISGGLLRLLFGLIVAMQLGVTLMTQSRFALISLGVAAVVFLTALRAIRRGETRANPARKPVVLGAALVVLLVCALFARPVIGRFSHLHDNSTAFRLWTWRGAARMAAANPIFGTGIGAWVDLYPRYALTGFTRLAHNSYLQMADECGVPALLLLLTTLGVVGVRGARSLRNASPDAKETLSFIAPPDDRLLSAGLLAGLAAGLAQNLVDSDWYVFFLGVTFWAVAGLTAGIASRRAPEAATAPPKRPRIVLVGSLAAFLLALFATQGTAALFGRMALSDDTPEAAAQDDLAAKAWDPWNARYPADLGRRVYPRLGRLPDAERELRTAAALEPNGTNFRRLGTLLDSEGSTAQAVSAYQEGLRVDPNSLDLRLALAQDSPPPQALALYRQMAALEDSPVGRVRAIGEVTEVKFAVADAALGKAASDAGNAAEALRFDMRAQRLLESYADEGGSTNTDQQALLGNHPAPDQDARMRDLYAQVMTRLAGSAPSPQKAALKSRAHEYAMRFLSVIAQGNDDTGDFAAAASALQDYADGGGVPEAKMNADMLALYEHVMDALLPVLPPDQQAATAARRSVYEQKFRRLLSPGQ